MPTSVSTARPKRLRTNQEAFRTAASPLVEASNSPQVNVGQRLRELRNRHRLSLRALAEKSGLNPNTLSLIENGKSSPSVATLQQMAAALGVPITAFFETSADTLTVSFQKANQRFGMPFASGVLEDLGAGIARRGIEPFLLILEPQADSGPTPIVHTGREFVFCLEGRLSYTVAGNVYLLEPGDSLLFEAYLPHRWENVGDKPSRSLLILCPTDAHDQPTERHFGLDEAHKR
jgi:transcriptional regulator with XRE-family HTH domain